MTADEIYKAHVLKESSIRGIKRGPEKEEIWKKFGYVTCYHPPVNETHLASYILVPTEKVYSYTEELYKKALAKGANLITGRK